MPSPLRLLILSLLLAMASVRRCPGILIMRPGAADDSRDVLANSKQTTVENRNNNAFVSGKTANKRNGRPKKRANQKKNQ